METPQQVKGSNSFGTLSLQEFVKSPITSIPEPFIQPDHQHPPFAFDHLGAHDIPSAPVIDMQLLTSEDHMRDSELEKLHSTCKEWGLFLLVNHGIEASVLEKLRHEVEEFFKLPLEEKMTYHVKEGDYQGYGRQAFVPGLNDKKLDWADRFYFVTNPSSLRKPNLLPELPPSLRDTLEAYILELQKLAMKLVMLMAKALKIEEKEMKEIFEDGMQSVRMTYYPPCPKPELVMGITPHSDGSLVTLLLQVNGVEGLQVKKDGVWIPVNFLPDSLVVNVGDILEILSNGMYKSAEHKAIVNSERERISVAMFFNPKLEGEVGPSISLIGPQNPPLFKRVGMQKYLKEFFSRKLDGKSYLEVMRIKEEQESINH
ncbi:hypothetical protein Ancab_033989 [Ancistrocladus abbreviatus]